ARPQTASFGSHSRCYQWTAAVVDEDLGVGEPILSCRTLAAEAHARRFRALDNVCAHRSAFGIVAVKKARISLPAQNDSHLPSQIVGVLDAGIHSLAAGRRMNVGSIACDEHVAHAVLVRKPHRNAEQRGPAEIAEPWRAR